MMKRTNGVRAHEFEHFVAPTAGDYMGRAFYLIDGRTGLYRRVGPSYAGGGVVSALWGDGLARFAPATVATAELSEAGFVHAVEPTPPPPDLFTVSPPVTVAGDPAFVIDVAAPVCGSGTGAGPSNF